MLATGMVYKVYQKVCESAMRPRKEPVFPAKNTWCPLDCPQILLAPLKFPTNPSHSRLGLGNIHISQSQWLTVLLPIL